MKLRWVVLALLLGALLWLALQLPRSAAPSAASPADATAASAPDLSSSQRESAEKPQKTAQTPAAGRAVNVRVTVRRFHSEAPVEQASVVARRGNETVRASLGAASTTLHELALAPGAWTVEATAEGLQVGTQEVLAPDSPPLELELWLNARGTTRVQLDESDWRQFGALARALDQDPIAFFDAHFTLWWSRDGTEATRSPCASRRFEDAPSLSPFLAPRAEGGDELRWELEHSDPRGTWLSGTFGTRSGPWTFVPADTNELVLPLRFAREEFEPPSLVLRVLDFAGPYPPAGAQVVLEPLESRRGNSGAVEVPRDGIVRFGAVLPGEYMLVASAPERADVHRIVRARLGRALDLGTLKLEPASGLEVLVRDGDGKPLPAFVSCVNFAQGELLPPTTSAREVHTDADGIARLAVGSGALVVRARVSGSAAQVPLTGHEAAPLLVLEPRPGLRVELVVRQPAEVGVSGAYGRVAIVDEQGIVVDGTWELRALWGGYLQPGKYRALDVTLEGQVVTERPFEVRAGQQLDFSLH
ncbi:MAG: hypothetical protein NTV21_06555 [Planctomycetota bacterium]|nr:hypothetical protein [Planctomycetota bacterium]